MALWKLLDWERNGYHDSDFYEKTYDDETGKIAVREIGTTRFAGGHYYSIHPDIATAPAEILAACQATFAAIEAKLEARLLLDAAYQALDAATEGRKVRVVRGRKVAHGTEGWVAARTIQTYGGVDKARLAIQTTDGRMVWTAETNVELIDGADVDWEALVERAAAVEAAMLAADRPWRHYGRAIYFPGVKEGVKYVRLAA